MLALASKTSAHQFEQKSRDGEWSGVPVSVYSFYILSLLT